MSSSRKSALLATVAALGLIAATVYFKQSNATRAMKRERSSDSDDTAAAAAVERRRSAMEIEEAAPLSLAPAPAGSKALVICKEGCEEASAAQQWAALSRSGGAAVSVCPPDHLESHAKHNTGTYDSIVVEEAGEGAVLGMVVKLLKAGGKVSVAAPQTNDAAAAAAAVKRALTFAGFLKVAPCPEDPRVWSGERAAWETGASAPVRLSFSNGSAAKNGPQNGAAASNGNGSAVIKTRKWAVDDDEDGGVFGVGGEGVNEDDDLVDEDALLESSAPVMQASEVRCATKRKPCKDCTCGRAEEIEMAEAQNGPVTPVAVVSVDDVDAHALTSACGNCSKGDAFRCAGCPFLGKPAFEKGQEKTIMLMDLDSQQDD